MIPGVAALAGLPWPVLAGAGAVVLALLVVVLGRLRKSEWLAGIGPQAVVALGGVAVSVHGLWGFATTTSNLSHVLAVAFIAVFDAAEMTLLVQMYRTADPAAGWTRELRLMHRTAWMQVGFSAAMNAVHAPNWWARPVLAAVPALAAWLIELQLRSKLHHQRPDEENARPGPARLVALLWQHAWSGLFALLGLDARSSSSAIARAALAQRAALRVYRLRLALESPDAGLRPRARRRTQRRTEKLRGKAQKALDRADVATDGAQALALVRRLAAITRAEEVARLDYRDAPAVLELIEDLAVTPAARRIESSALAERAEEERQRAESARQNAEDARKRAVDELAAARDELERARGEYEDLVSRQEGTSAQAEAARQRAEGARREEETARQRAERLLTDARTEAGTILRRAREDADQVRKDAAEHEDARQRAASARDALQGQINAQQQAFQQLSRATQEATLLRDRLMGELAALRPHAPETALNGDGPVWKSPAKQQGWTYYLHCLTAANEPAEPAAADLAERFGIDPGNARNWVKDFRAARAAQLAAQPRASHAA
ncbi:hypothetical protein [Streptomyces roseifaciens]|uniref:hypothetical protein n=1 Tax=Streptomyces roseifaciens TaxID=1488406 RepID=UPI000718000F|nr:hypothetical protein [Streptomyces roseifaciens]